MGFPTIRPARFMRSACENREVSQHVARVANSAKGEKAPVFTKVEDFFTRWFSAALFSKSISEVREPRKRRPKDFEVMEELGEGGFGKVVLSRERASEEMFAM